jgi:hypothetical protein
MSMMTPSRLRSLRRRPGAEHYEIARYVTLAAWAQLLGLEGVIQFGHRCARPECGPGATPRRGRLRTKPCFHVCAAGGRVAFGSPEPSYILRVGLL